MIEIWWTKLSMHEGRINRLQYLGYHAVLYFSLILSIVAGAGLFLIFDAIDVSLHGAAVFGTLMMAVIWLGALMAYVYCTVCVTVRRLHDMDLSGWWYAALFVIGMAGGASRDSDQIISVILSIGSLVGYISLLLVPGTSGPNRFDQQENN